jgi:hypothetical protein
VRGTNPLTTKDTKVHKGKTARRAIYLLAMTTPISTSGLLCVPSCPLWLEVSPQKKQAAPGDGAAWLAKSSGEEGELVYSDGPVG